jgi:putative transposase
LRPAQLPQRRSIRLAGYDYTAPGSYFITICTARRADLFGKIVDGQMQASLFGEIAGREWLRLEERFPQLKLDAFVVMPNHLHGIIILIGDKPGLEEPGAREGFGCPVPGSLPSLVRSYKSAVTLKINARRNLPGIPVWQRNYWEHAIRDEVDWSRIREYVVNNPLRWMEDSLYLPSAGA